MRRGNDPIASQLPDMELVDCQDAVHLEHNTRSLCQQFYNEIADNLYLAKMKILKVFPNLLHQLLLQGVYLDVGWHGLQGNRF